MIMDFADFKNVLTAEFPGVTAEQLSRFEAMGELYREWNSKINVISRKDIDNIYGHHVLHSLGIALYLKCRRPEVFSEWGGEPLLFGTDSGAGAGVSGYPGVGETVSARPGAGAVVTDASDGLAKDGTSGAVSVLDLGCGGGFPGIPLATLFPQVRFTLCDSIGKKVAVAREVAAALGLGNVETVNARAESLSGPYGYVVSRAVTSLDNFIPWVKGKYRHDIFYLKGGDLVEEIAAAMGRCRLPKGSVSVWPVSSVLRGEFFEGKMVIDIKNKNIVKK